VLTRLIIDLRDDTCAVGLLKITEQGIAQWYSENTLRIYVSPDTEDSRSVADLAFFRRGAERYWKPVLRPVLEDSRLADCECITRLLRETPDRLSDLLRVTLGRMLAQSLRSYPNVPLLVLLDNAASKPAVMELFKTVERKAQAVVITSKPASIAPFALWDTNLLDLPPDGTAWECVVEAPVNKRDLSPAKRTPGLPERRRYEWRSSRFWVKTMPFVKGTNVGLPLWQSSEELERVGAAMYALFWRERLMRAFQTDAETLQRELVKKQDLLSKLRGIYTQLTERGGPGKAAGHRQ
jgi:hypothetical protein